MAQAQWPPFDHRGDERGQRDDGERLAAQIDAARRRRSGFRTGCFSTSGCRDSGFEAWHPQQGRPKTGSADRQIDKEDAAPAEGGDQQPACYRAGRDGDRARRRPQPDGASPQFRVVSVRLIQQGERVRQHRGGADALQRSGGDQHRRAGRDAASQRREREQHDTRRVQPARAEAVAESTGRQHQHREGERVGVDDPLKARDIGVQIRADFRQRNIDDGHVELRDDEAHADSREHAAEGGRNGTFCGGHALYRRRDVAHHVSGRREVSMSVENCGCRGLQNGVTSRALSTSGQENAAANKNGAPEGAPFSSPPRALDQRFCGASLMNSVVSAPITQTAPTYSGAAIGLDFIISDTAIGVRPPKIA